MENHESEKFNQKSPKLKNDHQKKENGNKSQGQRRRTSLFRHKVNGTRDVSFGDEQHRNKDFKFSSNFIRTTKYRWYNFFFLSLLNQFRRGANIYFLIPCSLFLIRTSSFKLPSIITT